MQYSKKIVSGFFNSESFNEFKEILLDLDRCVINEDVDGIIDFLEKLGKSKEGMSRTINSLCKFIIDDKLSLEDLSNVDMIGDSDFVRVVYKKYIPSYMNSNGVYTSVDSNLLEIYFNKKVIVVKDIENSFEEAIRSKRIECMEETTKINYKKHKLEEMEANIDSKVFVVSTVMDYNKDALRKNAIEKAKCFISREVSKSYHSAYEEIMEELRDEINVLEKDSKEFNNYNYKSKLNELMYIQSDVISKLSDMDFDIRYEGCTENLEMGKIELEK